ncbi:MAG TPA: STN domain-containing protein [Planctomycetota bacterium]|nr:STN domain-containing protein [Planctomycetota bacterium]
MKTMAAILAMAACAWAGDSREDAVRRLETMKVTVDFENVKLPEAVDYLRDVTGLNLVILPKAMEKDGETPIQLKVKDLSVRSVLKLLLSSRGLTATYRDGAIVIVPKEELQSSLVLRIFDVRALQVKIQDFKGPVVELKAAGTKEVGGVFILDDPKTVIEDDFLLTMVRTNTGAGSWDTNSNAVIDLHNGTLVVTQTPAVLREIESLLNLLGQYQ